MSRISLVLLVLTLSPIALAEDHAPPPAFDRIVIDDNFPGAYQVEVADINGDQKPDIVALGGSTVAWYENPSWKKRIITDKSTAPSVISTATRDLDGDGKAEIAIAYDFEMNNPRRGELLLASQGQTPDDPWTTRHIGHFGSIHRIRWGDFDNNGQPDLIIAPIFGENAKPPTYDQQPATLLALITSGRIKSPATWKWRRKPLAQRPVIHAIEVREPVNQGPNGPPPPPDTQILTADNLGVGSILHDPTMLHGDQPPQVPVSLYPGARGQAPNRGSSEVHVGKLLYEGNLDARSYTATIEPWHGNKVVIWQSLRDSNGFPKTYRTVLDDTLDAGHALWTADVDNDGDDEIFAGHRGKDHRVSIYNYDGQSWSRTVLDRQIAAQDLRGGDLDADGTPDVVAVGGSTHNVIWYRPKTP